jgi:ribosomal protein S18 acetylase RimI-like enzyme
MEYNIRPLTSEDEPTLWEMLYFALQRQGEAPGRDAVRRPELARYVEGWGRPGDRGFLAQDAENGPVLGAAWLRLPIGEHKGYGFVDETTPELAFAVHPEHRKRGIATALLTQLARSTVDEEAISLSAAAGNPARRLYERFGFKVVQESADAIKMRR